MSIFRVKKNSNYVVMNRTALNDERLTWKAKGIIAYMLSMPDDWTFYVSELITHAKDGEKSFRSGLKELKDCGYVKRFPVYENKKIDRWETIIYESPQDGNLLTQNVQVGNEQVEKVEVENEALLSTDLVPSTEDELSIDKKIPFSDIISYLNEKISSKYRDSSNKTRGLIEKRWKEGYKLEDFQKVIDVKVSDWKNNDKMRKYLRPETLFGNKFEGYLNQDTKQTDDYDNLF